MTPRPHTRASRHDAVVHALRLAVESGDPGAVAVLLDPAVEMVTDGGGAVAADARLVRGPTTVAQSICAALDAHPAEIAEAEVNAEAALVVRRKGMVEAVVCVSVRRKRVTDLWVVLNPAKLRHWNPPRH